MRARLTTTDKYPTLVPDGGTRSQTLVVAERGCRVTWYCYRDTDSAQPVGGQANSLHVFGVPWPPEADGAAAVAARRGPAAGGLACAVAATVALGIACWNRTSR